MDRLQAMQIFMRVAEAGSFVRGRNAFAAFLHGNQHH